MSKHAASWCIRELTKCLACVLLLALMPAAHAGVPALLSATPKPPVSDPQLLKPAGLPPAWKGGSGAPAATTDRVDSAKSEVAPAVSREFRGMWVATVANIDWPSKKTLTTAEQQAEVIRIVTTARQIGFNAIVLQVRPCGDALYQSELEPWSEFLTGLQGKAPSPFYDPLTFWVEQAHQHGLELHVWLNPFRVRHIRSESPDAASHISQTKPALVHKHNGYLWLDPGEPEARKHSLDVIFDVIKRYDVDGLHFDDYFYPYPKEGEPFPDSAAFAKYGGGAPLDSWRRGNIDSFMRDVYVGTKAIKPHVKVGISPFGIWRPDHPPGIKGFDAYAKLHADSRKWLMEGWCDYFTPQLYWRRDSAQQGFDKLLAWWMQQNPRNIPIWPGIYTSRIPEKAAAKPEAPADAAGQGSVNAGRLYDAAEIIGQIESVRKVSVTPGVVHFSAIAIMQNRGGIADALRRTYAEPALVPEMTIRPDWQPAKTRAAVLPPPTIKLTKKVKGGEGGKGGTLQITTIESEPLPAAKQVDSVTGSWLMLVRHVTTTRTPLSDAPGTAFTERRERVQIMPVGTVTLEDAVAESESLEVSVFVIDRFGRLVSSVHGNSSSVR